ncbi:hypothetical protein PENSTE_c009G03725, partial [Penicillium steckii]
DPKRLGKPVRLAVVDSALNARQCVAYKMEMALCCVGDTQ